MLKHFNCWIKYGLTVRNQKHLIPLQKMILNNEKFGEKNRLKPMKCFLNNNRQTKLQELMVDSAIASGCSMILLICWYGGIFIA